MTLLRKLCSQKNLTLFNQVRSLLFLRQVCHNDNFHNSTLHSKGQLNRTFFTKKSELENIIEAVEGLENSKEIVDDDTPNHNTSSMNRNVHWTRLESKVLDSLVEKHGENWELVSQHMFDKTPQECESQYEKIKDKSYSININMRNSFSNIPDFNNTEVNQINNLIQKYGRNWRRISKYFCNKTPLDVESFVIHNPDRFPSLYGDPKFIKRYKGSAWTDHELKSLNQLIIKHGRNYDAIAEELPGRTPKAIERSISKHMLDLPALHSGKVADWFRSMTIWSESEIRLLNELVEVYGFNWEKISGYLPGRSPISCSAKFYGIWSTWNNKVTALVPHKWPKEVLQFLELLIEKYGKWQIIPILVPGITPANWISPFFPQSRVWTKDERLILQYLVKTIGYDWEKISEYFPHRQRWSIIREVLGNIEDYEFNHENENENENGNENKNKNERDSISKLISPKKRKKRSPYWPYEEIKRLYDLKEKFSSDWYKISSELPGRTPATCYLKDFVLSNACKELDNKFNILEMCHLQELLRNHSTDWETIAKQMNKDPNEIENIVNDYPKIFPPVLFGSQIKITGDWTEKEKELFKNLISAHGNNWKFIKNFFPRKSYEQIFEYYHANRKNFPEEYVLKTNYWVFHRATWKNEENELLKELLKRHGDDFEFISQHFSGRTSAAIRAHVRTYPELFYSDRENFKLESKYRKDKKDQKANMSWTTEDENKLLALVRSNPTDWGKIAAEFPSRTIGACKTKYRSLVKPEMTVSRFADSYSKIL